MLESLPSFFGQGIQMALVLLIAPGIAGLARIVKARLMRRHGPPLSQAYRDLAKLLRKEAIVAESASWLFRAAPYIIFALAWIAAALVPTFATGLLFSWTGDVIVIIALLGSARFFQTLAGMDVGTAFGGIGSSREVMIASLAEPAMLLVVLNLALAAGSSRLPVIADHFVSQPLTIRIALALALIALLVVALAENARIPVDNPATHLELTMVHEAMVLEYSGRHLAMIEAASQLKLVMYISLVICLFVPFGIATVDAGIIAWIAGLASYLAKLVLAAVALGVWELSIAKMRVFRVSEFLSVAFIFAFLAVMLAFLTQEVLQ
ncbi:MAG: NADH-quinone oxidoreductase subunit H [Rhodomicrobiaceae bacterium]